MIEVYDQCYDVEIESFLEVIFRMFEIKTEKKTSTEWWVHCPFHSKGQERTASASFRLTGERQGNFFCFGCQTRGSLSSVLTKLFGTKKKAENWINQTYKSIDREDKRLVKKILPGVTEVNQVFDLPSSLVSNYTPYFESRGIPNEIVKKYRLMYSPTKNAVIFPVYSETGEVIFYQVRYLSPGSMKWYIPKDAKPKIFGKLEVGKGPVYICESCFNALTLIKFGYNAVATFGARFDDTRFELLEIPNLKFVIAYDGDEAGRKTSVKLSKFLRDSGRLVDVLTLENGKDINDFANLSKEEFDKKLESWK